MSEGEIIRRSSLRDCGLAFGMGAVALLGLLACSSSPAPVPPPPPTPLPTPVVVPLADPAELAREVLAAAGFTVIEEESESGTIVARLRRSLATEDEEREAVAELRRIAHYDEELGDERIADYSIRVVLRLKPADSNELALAARAEIWASPRARETGAPSLSERQIVSTGVLERELLDRILASWSE